LQASPIPSKVFTFKNSKHFILVRQAKMKKPATIPLKNPAARCRVLQLQPERFARKNRGLRPTAKRRGKMPSTQHFEPESFHNENGCAGQLFLDLS